MSKDGKISIGLTPESSRVAGEGALLVDPLDVDSIRQGFERLLSDPAYREALVETGRENVMRYQPEPIAQQYAEYYRVGSVHLPPAQ